MLLVLLAPVAGYGEDFTLAIVVPLKGEIRYINFDSADHEPTFHVVLTNTSGKDLRIWESWNSWGYFNLSFELTREDGKMVVVERGPHMWTMNGTTYWMMKPGDLHIFDVWFPDDWSDLPNAAKKAEAVKLRAVFSSPASKDSEKLGVWSGTVKSPEVAVTLQDMR